MRIPATAPIAVMGDQSSSANVSATTSADLISAATNTSGVIITSFSMTLQETSTASTLDLLINGVIAIHMYANGTQDVPMQCGGFCAIEIPPGQAVSYTFTEGSTGLADIYITWRRK